MILFSEGLKATGQIETMILTEREPSAPAPQLRKQMLSGMGTEEESHTHAQAPQPSPKTAESAGRPSSTTQAICVCSGSKHLLWLCNMVPGEQGVPADTPGVSGTRLALEMTASSESGGGSSETKVAPTVVEQQQRQEDRHPLLLDAPVSHGELAQGMRKQALQSKWPVTLCWALLPSRASLTPAGRRQAGSTESLVRVTTEVPPAASDNQDRVRYVTCCFHEAVNSLQTESMSTPCISAWAASVRPVPTRRLAGLPRAQAHLQVTYPAGQLTEGTIY